MARSNSNKNDAAASVQTWLKGLRYETEAYEKNLFVVKPSDGEYENIWDFNTKVKISGANQSGGTASADKAGAPEGEGQGDDTRQPKTPKKKTVVDYLIVKHGEICRVSFDFNDVVEDFFVNPIYLHTLDFSLKANVLQWQSELLFDCSSEEEEMQEFISSLELINEQKMAEQLSCPTKLKLPTIRYPHQEESVQIRERAVDRRDRDELKAKTSCFDDIIKVEETNPLRVTNIKHIYENKEKKKSFGINITDSTITLYIEKRQRDICLRQIENPRPTSKKEITFYVRNEETTIRLICESQKEMNLVLEELQSRINKTTCASSIESELDKPEKSQIKSALLKLLGKRSKRDLLEKKGIIQNETIFGNTLINLQEKFDTPVPRFVVDLIAIIELEENIVSMGLYRASGNLATMQKIRLEVDCHKFDVLEHYKNEIDVLTGSLKMFFRELKEPLMPFDTYKKLLQVCDDGNATRKCERVKKILGQLPEAHNKTLIRLIQHLIKVEAHKCDNKMDTYNLSIVWGPTLTWPPEGLNESLLLNSTSASKVVELLINSLRNDLGHKNDELIKELKINQRKKSDGKDDVQTPITCTKRILNKDGVFGSTLELLCQDNKQLYVPVFVTKMIRYIEKNVTAVGIYRVPGNKIKIEQIIHKINKKHKLKVFEENKYEVYELAGVFKQFFLDLYEPLISQQIFENLVQIGEIPSEIQRLRSIETQINRLSVHHKETLTALLKHLLVVAQNQSINKMSIGNLAKLWGPAIVANPCYGEPQKAEHSSTVLEKLLLYQRMLDEDNHRRSVTLLVPCPNDSSLHRRSAVIRNSLYSANDHGNLI